MDLSDQEFRSIGVSRQKTSYIKALSFAVISKNIDLQSLVNKTPLQVREELIKIKGIGNWTIDVYLMFCLQAPDLLPLGDVAVVNTIKECLIFTRRKPWSYILKMESASLDGYFFYCGTITSKRNRTIVYQY
jgi:DNA-3-methyladenine glycosylase II